MNQDKSDQNHNLISGKDTSELKALYDLIGISWSTHADVINNPLNQKTKSLIANYKN